jgi:hypothetical protein
MLRETLVTSQLTKAVKLEANSFRRGTYYYLQILMIPKSKSVFNITPSLVSH